MAEFHFLRPWWLFSLLPAAALWWFLWKRQNHLTRIKSMIAPHLLEHLLVDKQWKFKLRPVYALALLWLLTILTLAGPSWKMELSPFADDKAGLMVILKVSSSMEMEDLQPNRLARAKQKLHDLLALRQGRATGLIVYAGSAHLVMPLSPDTRIIDKMVADITPNIMPADGDQLAQALQLADELMKRVNMPGSVLVIADTVAAPQLNRIVKLDYRLPVQFLSIRGLAAPVDENLGKAAGVLDGSVTRVAVDKTDVEKIAAQAQANFSTVSSASEGERWHDSGYALLPFIALFSLLWSRRGWLVQ